MYLQIYLQSVVSEFTSRFLQPERANIVPLITTACYFVALIMLIKLVRMLQRGEGHFDNHLYRWAIGILFITLFPNVLSNVLLRQSVNRVVLSAPVQPNKTEAGYIDDSKTQTLIDRGMDEKNNPLSLPATTGLESTINNPTAHPKDFGTDLQP